MTYDYKNELARVKEYYEGDPRQKRFAALILSHSGKGKTSLARTCRLPVHIDSFDPGGTQSVLDMIKSGDVIADTQWESDDPFNPTIFARWKKATELRFQIGYFNNFGTYMLDSSTKWGDAAMNEVLAAAGKAGEAPRRNFDYVPQKIAMVNYINKLMNLPCDFILTGHFRENEEIISVEKSTGVVHKTVEYRYLTTGQAVITIPLLFSEVYVLQVTETSQGFKRELITEAHGKYEAKSRLKGIGKLSTAEPADIKHILKKIGLSCEDKPKLSVE
jgi:hypothetical protein